MDTAKDTKTTDGGAIQRAELSDDAVVQLVRQAMAAGAAHFNYRVRLGVVDPAPVPEAFAGFPAEFVRIRRDLVDAAREELLGQPSGRHRKPEPPECEVA